ncbi:MAG: hypothetical protein U1F36_15220 [Planctomycetota bacterium]
MDPTRLLALILLLAGCACAQQATTTDRAPDPVVRRVHDPVMRHVGTRIRHYAIRDTGSRGPHATAERIAPRTWLRR